MCIYICIYIYAQKNMNIHMHIYMYIFKHIYKHICKYEYISILHVLTGGCSGDSRMWVVRETCLSPPAWYHWWVTVMASLVPYTVNSDVALEHQLCCSHPSPTGEVHGVTGPRVHARQLRTWKLSFFLWFWNPNSITEDPKDCPGPMPTVPGVAKMVRGPCLGAWIC